MDNLNDTFDLTWLTKDNVQWIKRALIKLAKELEDKNELEKAQLIWNLACVINIQVPTGP